MKTNNIATLTVLEYIIILTRKFIEHSGIPPNFADPKRKSRNLERIQIGKSCEFESSEYMLP